MFSYPRRDSLLLIAAAIVVNVGVLVFGWTLVRNNGLRGFLPKVGNELPLPHSKGFFMTVEDADRYGLYGDRADSEWLATTPDNNGYVHFGGEHRIFAVALAHQMHCIRVLRLAIAVPAHPKATSEHASHCLNYLRLYALCSPDLTLEKFDPLKSNFSSQSIGETHACHNWENTYDVFAKNTKEWLDLKRTMGSAV